jgi:CSLREA domain-containing protein
MGHRGSYRYGIRLIISAALLAFLAAPLIGNPASVAAASFTVQVTTTADASNSCAMTGAAPCSLRDAARYASAQMVNGPVIIYLPAGDYVQTGWDQCTAPPTSAGAFSITSAANSGSLHPVYIIGAGAGSTVVHGAGAGNTHYSVFSFGNADVTLTGMTITNGFADDCTPAIGGGIRESGGNLTLANVTVTGNAARGSGAGVYVDGGAHILNSQIVNNSGCNGGGIAIFGGSASVIANTTISGNQQDADPNGLCYGIAGGDAGGVAAGYGVLQITGSAIVNNSSLYHAQFSHSPGGIGVSGTALTIANSTIANNSSGDDTGGIVGTGTVALTNDTIAANISGAGYPQAVNRTPSGTYTLTGTIVRGSGTLCSGVTSGGYNIASDNSCALTGTGDHPTTDPQLGTFANHGGPTATYDLGGGSPALNAIPAASCPTTMDQRGVSRPQGGACDIGAYEAGATPPTLNAVAPTAGGTGGGQFVTLTGNGYTNGANVTVDAAGAPTTFVNSTALRVTMPSHSLGLADITVTVPGVGIAMLPRAYLYADVLPLPSPEPSGGIQPGGPPAPLPTRRTPGTNQGVSPEPLPSSPRPSSATGVSTDTGDGGGATPTAPAPLPVRR